MQKGSKANNVKNIFFITIGFYRLAPLGLELLPILLPLLLLEEELLLGLLTLELFLEEELLLGLLTLELLLEEELLLGLLTLELFLFDEEELEFGLTYSELERT